jgi:hypothetical protein
VRRGVACGLGLFTHTMSPSLSFCVCNVRMCVCWTGNQGLKHSDTEPHPQPIYLFNTYLFLRHGLAV